MVDKKAQTTTATQAPHSLPPFPWQENQWTSLLSRLAANRLPHALLLNGPAGLGKHAFAERLAQVVLCQAQGELKPCNSCSACQQFVAGGYPDYQHITLLEDKKIISVDQIRVLSERLTLASAGAGRWKIALIEPVDRMNNAASNALLKTLEEPGANTLLILVSAHPSRLLATLRSRCQQVVFPTPAPETALRWLGGRTTDSSAEKKWPELLRLAGGAPLHAVQLADSPLPGKRARLAEQLVAMVEGKIDPVSVAAEWLKLGLDDVFAWFIGWLMDAIQWRTTSQAVRLRNPDLYNSLQSCVKGLNLEAMHRYLMAVQRSRRLLNTNVNDQLLLEALLICWAGGLRFDDLSYLPQERQ